jgi:light-regulated signal transduction histidine kinase (bacteriophytochrome)
MKVLKGKIVKEIMGFDGVFIEFNSDGEGMLISEDKDFPSSPFRFSKFIEI